jgi:cell division septum initiation protein DivIVA
VFLIAQRDVEFGLLSLKLQAIRDCLNPSFEELDAALTADDLQQKAGEFAAAAAAPAAAPAAAAPAAPAAAPAAPAAAASLRSPANHSPRTRFSSEITSLTHHSLDFLLQSEQSPACAA